MKTGLVLEGGGIRAIFEAGILDVLMEEGIEFDGVVGVSAGAAFGCNYKSGQPRRAIRYNLKYAKDPRYSSMRSLLSTGDLFNAQFCYHDIPEKLYPFDWDTFRANPMQFYLVCTDVETGKPVYHLCDNDDNWEMLEWFRASGSMPLVSRVVEIGGKKLLDGGISDSIPLRFMEEQGYERNVVILTRPATYIKQSNPMMRVMGRALRNYPATVEALANRHAVYNAEVAYVRQREAGKYAYVIRPETDIDVGRVEHDRFKIREAYKAGRKAGRRHLAGIRRFLENAKKAGNADSVKASIIGISPAEQAKAQRAAEETAAAPVELTKEIPAVEETPVAAKPAAAAEVPVAEEPVAAPVELMTEIPAVEETPVAAETPAVEEPAAAPAELTKEIPVAEETAAPGPAEQTEEAPGSAGKPAESADVSGVILPHVRGRRNRRNWKPGNMTALKQRSGKE